MRFSALILRNLMHRKLRSFLAITGIAIALSSAVALLALSQEFEGSLKELYDVRGVEMLVVRAGVSDRLSSHLPQSLGEKIRGLAGVRDLSPVLVDVVAMPERNLLSVPLQGWTTGSFMFHELNMRSGRLFEKGEPRAILVGQILARNLQLEAGSRLTIESVEFNVVGVFESFNIFENSSVVMSLEELQSFMDRPGQVTAFELVLEPAPDKPALMRELRQQIEAMTDERGRPARLAALPVQEHLNTVTQIQMVHAMAFMTAAIAFLIGILGISNTMVMAVSERTHEIGILRALGWRRSRILRMVVAEGFLLSLAGSVTAIVLGKLLLMGLSSSSQASGLIQGIMPASVAFQGLLLGCGAGFVGGLYPAWRASTLLPMAALRHEG